MPDMHNPIKAIVVYNPLNVSEATTAELEYSPNKPLSAYLEGLPEDVTWSVALDGKTVDVRAADLIVPRAGATLVVAPEILGDDGGGAFALIATIALAAFAPWAGGAIAGALGFSSTGMAAAIAAAGVSIAGGLLISAMSPIAAQEPDIESQESRSSFGIDGAKNTSTENIPVPVIYGRHAFGGNYVDLYTENAVDADGNETQIVYGRIAISEGPIHSIKDIKINDQPVENFESVTIDYRLGEANQSVSEWFDQTVSLFNDGRKVSKGGSTIYSTTQEVDKLRLDIVFPSGLYRVKTGGPGIKDQAVRVAVRWRKTGTSDWTYLSYDENAAPIGVSELFEITITDTSSAPVRRSFYTPVLEQGYYDIEIQRLDDLVPSSTTQMDFNMSDVGEIILDTTSLPYTAWVGFRAVLSDDITGIPKLTGIARGRILDIYDHNGEIVDQKWSANPRDVELDMLMNKRYGSSASKESIDFASRAEWAEFCDENDFRFDGVFDTMSNIEDETRHVYVAGRAERVHNGGKSLITFDAPTTPTMVFGEGSIVDGSFELNYIGTEDRVNDIEIKFFDKDADFAQSSARQVDENSIARGQPVKSSSVFRKGIVSMDRADRDAVYLMNQNHLIRRIAKWRAPLEALQCAAGDVVRVQRREMNWQDGGRVMPGSSVLTTFGTRTRINVDHPLTMKTGTEYKFLVHMNERIVGSHTISNQSGNLVTVGGVVEPSKKLRLSTGTDDFAVVRVLPGEETTDLLLETRAGAEALSGKLATLIRTDEFLEYDVMPEPSDGDYDRVLISGAIPLPEDYANFIFGKADEVARHFRIRSIKFNGEDFEIEGIEYNEQVYSDTPVVPSVLAPAALKTFNNVLNLDAEEILIELPNGTYRSKMRARWKPPATGEYINAIVQVSVNGGKYIGLGRHDRRCDYDVEVGDVVTFRVLARTTDGTIAARQAPTVTVTAQGYQFVPDAPENWTALSGALSVTLRMVGEFPDSIGYYRFFAGAAGSSFEDASLIGEGKVSSFEANPDGSADIARYWVTAVSIANKESAPSAPIDAVPVGVLETDLDAGLQEKFDAVDTLQQEVTDFIESNATELAAVKDAQALAQEGLETAETAIGEAKDSIAAAGDRIDALKDDVDIDRLMSAARDVVTNAEQVKVTAEMNGNLASYDQRINTTVTDIGAVADRVTTMETNFGDSSAIFNEDILTYTDAYLSLAGRVQEIESVFSGGGEASFLEDIQTLSDEYTALSERTTNIETSLGDGSAIFTEEITTFTDVISSLAEVQRGLVADFGDTSAIFDETITTYADAVKAVSDRTETLESNLGDASGLYSEGVTTIADVLGTVTQRTETLESTLGDVSAIFTDEVTTVAQAFGSLSTRFTEIQSAYGSADSAEDWANAAATSADTASSARDEAGTYAGAANTSRINAQTAQGLAEDARDAAVGYRNQASGYRDQAVNARDTAQGHAATAAEKAGLAATSADDAYGYANAASTSADTASTKAGEAGTYASAASTARNEATTAKNSAFTYKEAAATSATDAAGSATRAYELTKVATQMIGSESFSNPVFDAWDGSSPDGVDIVTSSSEGQTFTKRTNGKYGNSIELENTNTTATNHQRPYVSLRSDIAGQLDLPSNPAKVKGLRVTAEVEKRSGSWGGGCIRVAWQGTGGSGNWRAQHYFFDDFLAGENDVIQTLEFDCYQPEDFDKGDGGRVYVQLFCNSEYEGRARTTVKMRVHRISVKQLTETSASKLLLDTMKDVQGNLASKAVLEAKTRNGQAVLELAAADGSDGSSFSGAKLDADEIVLDGSVSMRKIASTIQSTNYDQGKKGWKIWKSGKAEFNGEVSAPFVITGAILNSDSNNPIEINGGVINNTGNSPLIINGGEINNPDVRRQLKIASGSFQYTANGLGNLQEHNIYFVNTGIRIGQNQVWNSDARTLMATVSVIPNSVAATSSASFWRAKAEVYEAFKFNGSTNWGDAKGFQYEWTKDPPAEQLVDRPWATGNTQRMLMDINIKTNQVSIYAPFTVSWSVYEVT